MDVRSVRSVFADFCLGEVNVAFLETENEVHLEFFSYIVSVTVGPSYNFILFGNESVAVVSLEGEK